jgi:hypothetical protein
MSQELCISLLHDQVFNQAQRACVDEVRRGEPSTPAMLDSCRERARDAIAPFAQRVGTYFARTSLAPLPLPLLSGESVGEQFGAVRPEALAEIDNRIRAACAPVPAGFGTSGASHTLVYAREYLAQRLPGVLASVDESCRRRIVAAYVANFQANLRAEISARTISASCESDLNAAACERPREAWNATLAAFGAVPLPGLLGEAIQCARAFSDAHASYRWLGEQVADIVSCVQLANGGSQSVSLPQTFSDIAASYRLSRTGDQSYRAELNLAFPQTAEGNAVRSRLTSCLSRINSTLATGTPSTAGVGRLELAVSAPGATDPPPRPIQILPASGRSHSVAWESDIDCETMTHEMMHLLGLVDEYREQQLGYVHGPPGSSPPYRWVERGAEVPGYACRTLGPSGSLMTDMYAAFRRVAPPATATLLLPAQFRAITQPGCNAANRTYYSCARTAYSSVVPGTPGSECPVRSAACLGAGASWLD